MLYAPLVVLAALAFALGVAFIVTRKALRRAEKERDDLKNEVIALRQRLGSSEAAGWEAGMWAMADAMGFRALASHRRGVYLLEDEQGNALVVNVRRKAVRVEAAASEEA